MKIKDCKVGHVYHFFTNNTIPPKDKFCLCVGSCRFFLINSKPLWPGSVKIERVPDHLFLAYDSFIECGNIVDEDENSVITTHCHKGKLSEKMTNILISFIPGVVNLVRLDKKQISDCLRSFRKELLGINDDSQ